MGLEHALGAIVLGNIGVIAKLVASVRKSSAREATQNARLDALEKDVQEQKTRNGRLFEKLDELNDSVHGVLTAIATLNGRIDGLERELRGRGHLNGGRHMRPVGPEDYQTRGLDSRG